MERHTPETRKTLVVLYFIGYYFGIVMFRPFFRNRQGIAVWRPRPGAALWQADHARLFIPGSLLSLHLRRSPDRCFWFEKDVLAEFYHSNKKDSLFTASGRHHFFVHWGCRISCKAGDGTLHFFCSS